MTRDKTGFQGHIIVDEKNEIAKELKRKGFVDVAISAKKGYQYGMAQPAVVVLGKGGVVLESWAIVPGTVSFDIALAPSLALEKKQACANDDDR